MKKKSRNESAVPGFLFIPHSPADLYRDLPAVHRSVLRRPHTSYSGKVRRLNSEAPPFQGLCSGKSFVSPADREARTGTSACASLLPE